MSFTTALMLFKAAGWWGDKGHVVKFDVPSNYKTGEWIGVDFDGVLARYDRWNDGKIGEPIMPMVERVRFWLDKGIEVRIFTSRCGKAYPDQVLDNCRQIQLFCLTHFNRLLKITNEKDQLMCQLWDDNAVQVIKNTGLSYREYHAQGRE
jgi:hypothetical protein